jgi:hypothetical protein
MRTFSGYTSVLWAYSKLSVEAKAILRESAFGPLIQDWLAIYDANVSANLVILRAFLDRFWDTTSTFHLPGYEAGPTFSEYAIISGLPCGEFPISWSIAPPPIDDPEVLSLIGGGLKATAGKKKYPF